MVTKAQKEATAAAAKAEEERLAKEAGKSPAGAAGGSAEAAGSTTTTSAPAQQLRKKRPSTEEREFDVLRPLDHDGERYEIGSSVELSREEFRALKAATVVDGEWPDDQEA